MSAHTSSPAFPRWENRHITREIGYRPGYSSHRITTHLRPVLAFCYRGENEVGPSEDERGERRRFLQNGDHWPTTLGHATNSRQPEGDSPAPPVQTPVTTSLSNRDLDGSDGAPSSAFQHFNIAPMRRESHRPGQEG